MLNAPSLWHKRAGQWSVENSGKIYNESHLFLMLARKTATKRTEVLLYPGTSFVSELGGSLGLFVGFSFWMVWDLAEITITLLFKWSNKKNGK